MTTARPLRTSTDVLRRVDALIDSDARCSRSLWLMFVDAADRQLPVITIIDDVPDPPDQPTIDGLCTIIRRVIDGESPGGSVIVVLTDPSADVSTDDFARLLRVAASRSGTPIRMLCLASHAAVRQLL